MKKESFKSKIVKNSFWGFLSGSINRVGSLIFTIFIARLLMPEGYGLYSIVISVVMILHIFADLGINAAFVKYSSSALNNNKKKLSAYYRYLLKLKFTFVIIFSGLALILAYPLAFWFFKDASLFFPFIIGAFYIFALSFEGFYLQMFYSLERVKYVGLKEILNQILKISFPIILMLFVASSYHLMGVFISLTLISIIMVLFIICYLKRLIPIMFEKSDEQIDKRRIRRFVGYLTIASISNAFFVYIDSIMLGFFLKPEFVGYYKAAYSLVMGLIGFIGFPNAIFLAAFTKSNKERKERTFNQIIRYLSILIIPSIAGLLILGKFFIKFFFGESYLPATLPLNFLALLILPVMIIGIFVPLFSSEEKPEIFSKIILFITILNIFLNIIFIKLFLVISEIWAVAGAAIATLISWGIYFIAILIASKKDGFKVRLDCITKPVIASVIMAGVLLGVLRLIKDVNLFWGIISILLGCLVYFAVMILIKGLRKEDIDLLKIIVHR